jgi:Tol biopolymer transport system component
MSVAPGARLGPYEVTGPLGAGGMGEVYRARDPRLGRDVAIKVLPQHLSANVEVRARFEREAKTVSSLNHPHICTLFDVGREGDTDFLVMELIEGETLSARLAKGALPGPEVLRLGAQIADALDRAHRAGVVHRDLKPGNVMLTRSGAKLMDFGLARATGMAGSAGGGSGVTMAALSQSPTVAQPLTAEGTIVGTFQYMSPEQLEGGEADARSDLWALGCVLYEMATGRRAFEGKSQASLITAIMGSEPPPVSQVAPLAPAGLDRLIRTCLTKDADERVQTAHDVKLQLLGIAEGGSQAGAPAAAGRRRGATLPWAIAAICGLAAVALAFAFMSRELAPRHPVQLSLTAPEYSQFTWYSSLAAISPDGRAVAFCAVDSGGSLGIWLQALDSPDAVRLARTEGIAIPFWSPDSRTIGLQDLAAGKLMTVPVGGGTPVTLIAAPAGRGATWNRRGVIVYSPRTQGPLLRITASGGQPVQVTSLDSTRHEASHRFPCFLPDGDHFLFASLPPGPEGIDIYVGSLGSRAVRKIMTAESAPTYAEPRYLLFRRGGKVMAQRFDARGLELQGDPIALADAGAPSDLDAEPVAAASQDGRLVHLVGQAPERQIEWLDRTGASRGMLSLPPADYGEPVLSPDGRFAIIPRGGDLWRVDLARSVGVRLTSGGDLAANPVWSPDGARIAFTGRRGGEEIFEMSSDGSGDARVLPTTSDLFKTPEDWTREGLIFNSIGRETFRDIWLAPSGGGPPTPLIRTRFAELDARVSPDGRWMAYISNEGGDDDVYIQSFPVPGHKVRVSASGAWQVLGWMPGSDEVCYQSGSRAEMVSVKLTRRGDDLEAGEPRILFRFAAGVTGVAMSHDGQRVLVTAASAGAQQRKLRVILDWTALMKR